MTKQITRFQVRAPKSDHVVAAFDNKKHLSDWLENRPVHIEHRIFEVTITEKELVFA